ncbi:F-box/LRR-repeat protein 2-like [Dreissena polymorpha]|uniref:F-box/LRR-repeat protein 15-like leucin rich repeat domain-containing protein n=1 Tax=Dreissena polymorpha TaxID=45954 RepID=A0A9D3YXM3_DREPO|nr:F-box/LRR-repeat protein 2-like [Dreissena polymorpha]KAH3706662.1 hypothetical protein DPMN_066050 [Dreissena polymorpha]
MVKQLKDVCLTKIQHSLDKLQNVGDRIPTVYKEVLLERLAWHKLFTENYIPYIAKTILSPSLTKVNFYKCEQIDDRVLSLLGSTGCKLESIKLNACPSITDYGIHHLTRCQDRLVLISLKKLRLLTDHALKFISSDKLQYVEFNGCPEITFSGVAHLATSNRHIKELHLYGLSAKGKTSTSHFMNVSRLLGPNLEVLDIRLFQLSDECLVSIATQCPNLRQLNLHGNPRMSGEDLTKVCIGCNNLQKLDLSFCTQLRESPDNQSLWTLPTSLTELSLTGVQLTDEEIFVECLQRLRRLRAVTLCGVSALNDDTLTKILQSVGQTLCHLNIGGYVPGVLSDVSLEAVSKYCFNLEELLLSLISNMTGEGLLPLVQDPVRAAKLRTLSLSTKKLSMEVLAEVVTHSHNLESIDLSGVVLVDDDLLILMAHNCRKLKIVCIKGCKMVTDIGVCALVRSCDLHFLSVSGINNLTDQSVFLLANSCHNLTELYMNGCANISPVAVRYLRDCTIPYLFVTHVTPNAKPFQLMAKNLDTGMFCRVDDLHYETQAVVEPCSL